MQFSLQVSPDGSDKLSVIRAQDRVQVTPCIHAAVAGSIRDALNKADAQLGEYVPYPYAGGCLIDPEGFKRARKRHDISRESLLATLKRVMPEAFASESAQVRSEGGETRNG